jgi:hypothetical protein
VGCPSCGWQPDAEADRIRLREDLATEWWAADPDRAGAVVKSRHCVRCQPHQVYVVACFACGDGPILAGDLAMMALDSEEDGPPAPIREILEQNGWRPALNGAGWVCCR